VSGCGFSAAARRRIRMRIPILIEETEGDLRVLKK
jgi:hypothetical protein